jgi:hypothetical protein
MTRGFSRHFSGFDETTPCYNVATYVAAAPVAGAAPLLAWRRPCAEPIRHATGASRARIGAGSGNPARI